jgi:hypothetical protein
LNRRAEVQEGRIDFVGRKAANTSRRKSANTRAADSGLSYLRSFFCLCAEGAKSMYSSTELRIRVNVWTVEFLTRRPGVSALKSAKPGAEITKAAVSEASR